MIYNIGSRVVNNYLVSFDAGFILVDTGYEGGFPHFLKMLEKHHIQPEEIKYLLLTHAHDDHAGFLNEVLEATGAEVILNRKAIDGLKRGQNSFEGGCSSILAWLFCQVLILLGHGNHRYPAIISSAKSASGSFRRKQNSTTPSMSSRRTPSKRQATSSPPCLRDSALVLLVTRKRAPTRFQNLNRRINHEKTLSGS